MKIKKSQYKKVVKAKCQKVKKWLSLKIQFESKKQRPPELRIYTN